MPYLKLLDKEDPVQTMWSGPGLNLPPPNPPTTVYLY